jgi:hypothetical protein
MFLHRLIYGGILGLATPELEQDVRAVFVVHKIDLGGKTLEQYLEQLRIAVHFREREGDALRPPGLTHVTQVLLELRPSYFPRLSAA